MADSKEHPILFSGDMVRAILAGRKTQTRRVIKPQPKSSRSRLYYVDRPDETEKCPEGAWIDTGDGTCFFLKCPYGKPGDKLWVREGYQINSSHSHNQEDAVRGFYLADDIQFTKKLTAHEASLWNKRKKPFARTSGRFMYRSLARLKPEITNIRVERVQEISEEDTKAEGIDTIVERARSRVAAFSILWDSINAKRGHGWEANPWVWVIEFKRINNGR